MEYMPAQYAHIFLPHLPLLGKSLVSAFLLCLTGLPFLAAAAHNRSLTSGRAAYAKCAGQLARCALLLGSIGSIGGLALLAAYCGFPPGPDFAALFADADPRAYFPLALRGGSVLCVLFATLFILLYTNLGSALRELPRLHQLTALSASFCAYAALYLTVLLHYEQAAHITAAAGPAASPHELFFPDGEAFWGAVSCLPFTALALAGGYGALWLLLRRGRDDYGRDHYNLVLPWCVLWARNSWFLLWLLSFVRFALRFFEHNSLTGGSFDPAMFTPELLLLCIFLAPGLWWFGVSRSVHPLRAKIALFLAPLVATAFVAVIHIGLV